MKRIHGKHINLREFKSDWLQLENLLRMRQKCSELANYVKSSDRHIFVDQCYVCKSRERELFGTIYGIDYWKCRNCSHVYSGLRLDENDLINFYKVDADYSRRTYANPSVYQYRARQVAAPKVDFVSQNVLTDRRRWLDVGCGNGDIVFAALNRGYDATGLEISQESIKFAEAVFGLKLLPHTAEELLKSEGEEAFDIVSFFGVLEHMHNPRVQVETAHRLLSNKGLLVIEVPNAESFGAKVDLLFNQNVVRHMYPPLHIMAFTQKSLLYLLNDFGFQPEAIWFLGLDFYNFFLHVGMQCPRFLGSKVAEFLLDINNEIQKIIDQSEMSDEIIVIARKV